MKILCRWATVGFAVLAFVLGAVIAWEVMQIMIPASFDRSFRSFDGSSTAVFGFVSNSVYVVTLVLASRRSGSNVLAYLGLDIPRWRHIAAAIAALLSESF